MAIIEASIRERMDTMDQAILRIRSNFAVHHLRAATQAAREAHEIEAANPNAPHGPWFDGMLLAVPVAITMASAALEANANEIIEDILGDLSPLSKQTSPEQRSKLEELRDDLTGNCIDKFRRLAGVFGKKPDTGIHVWQDARNLVLFRNTFMHFKPAWDDQTDVHNSDLVKALRPRVPISPGFRDRFQFPYGFMTYGCAKWAVETVLVFADKYAQTLGVEPRLHSSNYSLPKALPSAAKKECS